MKAIKFLTACTVGSLYNKGEVAGFEDAVADDLIKQGVAEAHKAGKGGKGDKGAPVSEPAAEPAAEPTA